MKQVFRAVFQNQIHVLQLKDSSKSLAGHQIFNLSSGTFTPKTLPPFYFEASVELRRIRRSQPCPAKSSLLASRSQRRDGRPGQVMSKAPGGGEGLLDLARIFLRLRFSLRIRFLRHLARIFDVRALGVVHSSKPLERKSPM